jgi:hypothetical protein
MSKQINDAVLLLTINFLEGEMRPNKSIITTVILFSLFVLSTGSALAQFSLGADVVSRYIWRGFDLGGNQLCVQPAIAYAAGAFEIGAWGSFGAVTDTGNENDLYISYSAGPLSFIFTDYFFPAYSGHDSFFKYGHDDAIHILEVGASFSQDALSVSGYINVSGDDENSIYGEVSYALGEIEGIETGFTVGGGTGLYDFQAETETNFDLALTNIGLSLSKGSLSASYIINPNQETSFLVFGYSF